MKFPHSSQRTAYLNKRLGSNFEKAVSIAEFERLLKILQAVYEN